MTTDIAADGRQDKGETGLAAAAAAASLPYVGGGGRRKDLIIKAVRLAEGSFER